MTRATKALLALLLVYGAASRVHFIHNAEFLAGYPGLPATTILLEATAAGLVMAQAARLAAMRARRRA